MNEKLSSLNTETRNPRSLNLDQLSTVGNCVLDER
jgi:hypothetical protein